MKKKFYSIILVIALCLNVLTSCNLGNNPSSGGNQTVNSTVPDFSDKTGQFGFMTYSVPLPTDEQFQLYKEAGLRTMLMDGEYLGYYQGLTGARDGVDLGVLEEFFRLAKKYDIKILDRSMQMETIMQDPDRYALYKKYPDVFQGFFMSDEPSAHEINRVFLGTDNANLNWVNENYPDAIYTTTLHPSWAPVDTELNDFGETQLVGSMEEYYKYMVDNVLTKVNGKGEKILCTDDYPCKRYGYDGKNYLNTLLIMSTALGDNRKITKQMCLNCSTFREVNESNEGGVGRPEDEWQHAYTKEVTEMELRMPAISALAFGFKSFLYFKYGPYDHSDHISLAKPVYDENGNLTDITTNYCPINYNGADSCTKTKYYDYVKDLTLEFESFEKCFTSFNWYGTHMVSQSGIYDACASSINSEYDFKIQEKFSNLSSYNTSGDADVLIGYFKQNKNTKREAYFVSNFCGYTDISEKTRDSNGFLNNAKSYKYEKNAEVTLNFNNFDYVYIVKNGKTITDQKLVKHALSAKLEPGDYMFVIPYNK